MSKFGAFLIIILLFGAIFYIYDRNTNDVGVKVDKLKLRYTIGENASPEKILQFSQDLSDLANQSNDVDKKQLLFESNLWFSTGISKEIALELSKDEKLTDNCLDTVLEMKNKIKDAKQSLIDAKLEYELIKANYTNVQQQDYDSRFSSIEYSLQLSEDLLFINCPN